MTVAACTPVKLGRPQVVAEPDSVSLMLADAADRASKALETLSAVEQVRTPSAAIATIPNAPVELKRGISVDWSGPVEPLAQTLAAKTGYQYSTFGDQPPTPIIVNVQATNRPMIEVFRDVGLQLGSRADLRVDAARRLVEIHYAPVANPTL